MTDRELLEAAAKAAGINIDPIDAMHEPENWFGWNPLMDDGDALRLAVELRLGVSQFPFDEAHVQWDHGAVMESYDGDPCAATRRAIVRAAAATSDGNQK